MNPSKRAAAFGVLAAALAAQTVWAHGPSRQKATETIDVNAPADKVWAIIGNFQDMSWLPVVEKTTGTDGNTPEKAKRTLTLKGGPTVDEELTKYDATGKTYSYRIDKVDVKVLPVNNYSSTISVTPVDASHSKVEWRAAFYRGDPLNDPPPALNDEAAMKAVTGLYKTGLAAIKAKAEKAN
ncbi:MAG: SRPBCC family protein [Hyphomicrobiales bacterium]|nr:SRPBCC family protein [Hyphomicrobiales bacterium]